MGVAWDLGQGGGWRMRGVALVGPAIGPCESRLTESSLAWSSSPSTTIASDSPRRINAWWVRVWGVWGGRALAERVGWVFQYRSQNAGGGERHSTPNNQPTIPPARRNPSSTHRHGIGVKVARLQQRLVPRDHLLHHRPHLRREEVERVRPPSSSSAAAPVAAAAGRRSVAAAAAGGAAVTAVAAAGCAAAVAASGWRAAAALLCQHALGHGLGGTRGRGRLQYVSNTRTQLAKTRY